MTKKFPYLISIVMILTLAACGSASTPTLTADDIRLTAVANAWLVITLTQAAVPTATITPLPTTTLTPLPTPTAFPTLLLPTSGPAAGTTPTLNPCYDVPPVKPKGTVVQIKLVNYSRGLVDLNLGMENPNTQGECATYFFRLGRFDQQVVSVLAACYWGFAYITDPTSNAETIAPLCLYDTTKTIPVSIGTEVIELD